MAMMSWLKEMKTNTTNFEPDRYVFKYSPSESVFVFKGVKRAKLPTKAWVVNYKRRITVFYDHDHSNHWRASLMAAEEFLMSVFVIPGTTYPKVKFKTVVVKRPYSKDPNDLIQRVKLSRYGGGYKFFDLDESLEHGEAKLKAFYEAEDYHWDLGIRLGMIKNKPPYSYHQKKLLGLLND